jgi:phosphatidylglycerophosphatase A
MKKTLYLSIASGLGSGFTPKAQGTVASLLYLLVFYLLVSLGVQGIFSQVILLIVISIAGLYATIFCLKEKLHHKYGKQKISYNATHDDDPSFVVIDEWAGMQFALLTCSDLNPVKMLIAFLLFRIFDVIKPKPISDLEKIGGAFGVMLDDLAAGLAALSILIILEHANFF